MAFGNHFVLFNWASMAGIESAVKNVILLMCIFEHPAK
jgi:hypothetical protein